MQNKGGLSGTLFKDLRQMGFYSCGSITYKKQALSFRADSIRTSPNKFKGQKNSKNAILIESGSYLFKKLYISIYMT